jgi:D,D-heptose 1,7-bisphosphate phosphatase
VEYVYDRNQVRLIPGVAEAIRQLNDNEYKVVIITNQPGVARGYFTEETLIEIDNYIQECLAKQGARIDATYYCPHYPEGIIKEYARVCDCRKPKPGMILGAARDFNIDLKESVVIGDREIDVEAGKRAGCQTILLTNGDPSGNHERAVTVADHSAADLLQAVKWLLDSGRNEDKSMKRSKMPGPIVYDTSLGDIPSQVLKELYRTMLRIQKVELKVDELYHQDEMKTPVHLCLGQEAIAAGFCSHLGARDYVFSNHRGHGHYIAKGGDVKAMIAELYNRETGCSKGRGGSMHIIDTSVGIPGTSSIVAGNVPIATGAALGSLLKKDGRVSVSFFGDAAVEEGVIYESINFAMLKKLPVIYVCENNLYSVYSPLSKRQANDDIYHRFEGLSIPGYRVDGNNVIDVYRLAGRVIGRARDGGGPSFVECRTYRLRDHHGTTSGVELGYRTQEEVDAWVERCPVRNFERFLLERKIMTETEKDEFTAAIKREVEEAFKFAQNSPFPDEDEVLENLYR